MDAEEQKRLKALAEARQRKPHFLMKEAVRQYLDREEKRESFRQEALASWREYRETGFAPDRRGSRSGYIAWYRYEAIEDAMPVLAVRHRKEAGHGPVDGIS